MVTRIPVEYQEVEYLESTGTQWIDTGTTLNNGCIITIDFLIEESTDNRIVYGWRRKGSYWNTYHAAIGANQNKVRYVAIGASSGINTPSHKFGHIFEYGIKNRIVIDSVNKYILVNGTVTDCGENFDNGNAFSEEGSSEYNPYLFAMNNSGTRLAMTRDTKIYAYSVKYGNEFSQHFIPCYRKSDNKPGMYDTVSKTFYTNSGSGEFLVGNNVYYDTTNLLESRRRILLTTPHLESPTPANPLTFKTDMTTKLKEGKVYFTPIQEGEGDPSPDNVRPISGWDGITVTKCGKNLVDGVWRAGRYINGAWSETNTWLTSNPIPVNPGSAYCTSSDDTGDVLNMYYNLFDADGNYLNYKYTRVIETTDLTSFLTVCNARSIIKKFQNLQLELGSTPTDYEPYTETKITIPFPKTIYGGYVDLVNGEVVEEYTAVTLDGENVKCNYGQYPSTYYYGAGWAYAKPAGKGYDVPSALSRYMCDILPNASVSTTVPHYAIPRNGKLYYMIKVLPKSDYPDGLTDEEVIDLTNEWLKVNPTTFAYPLATPVHHAIDPHILTTLRGANTIWSNSNSDVEITYWKHNDDAYQHVPSSPILSNDNFIIVTDDGYAIGEEDDFIVY